MKFISEHPYITAVIILAIIALIIYFANKNKKAAVAVPAVPEPAPEPESVPEPQNTVYQSPILNSYSQNAGYVPSFQSPVPMGAPEMSGARLNSAKNG